MEVALGAAPAQNEVGRENEKNETFFFFQSPLMFVRAAGKAAQD